MSTTWEEASLCPRDGAFTGKVISQRNVKGEGTIYTLVCPESNCSFHDMGWIVQKRPDGTIPDPQTDRSRPRQFKNTMTEAAKQQVRDALAQQVAAEQKPGYEIGHY